MHVCSYVLTLFKAAAADGGATVLRFSCQNKEVNKQVLYVSINNCMGQNRVHVFMSCGVKVSGFCSEGGGHVGGGGVAGGMGGRSFH